MLLVVFDVSFIMVAVAPNNSAEAIEVLVLNLALLNLPVCPLESTKAISLIVSVYLAIINGVEPIVLRNLHHFIQLMIWQVIRLVFRYKLFQV